MAPARRKGVQDITAYVIVSVAHYLVVVVGFGFVAFLMYHDRGNWGLLFVGILLFALLCQSSYTNKKAHVTCPSCGYEFEVRECEKCE